MKFAAILIIAFVIYKFLAKSKKKDWLSQAQERQNNRYEYSDPAKTQKPKKLRHHTWTTDGWYYDENQKKWIGPDYQPEWEYNPKTRMWVNADQLNKKLYREASEKVRQKWENLRKEEAELEALRTPIYLTEEEKELAKQIRVDRTQPTYEEWKAAQMNNPPAGTYHYDFIHIPNNETITEVKIIMPNKGVRAEAEKKEVPPKTNPRTHDDANVYEARPILTKNEARNYRTLIEAASKKGYTVNIKPRLADIATPRDKDKQYMANFRRISQKHVDFVILDSNMRIRAVIELDDRSHDTEKGKKRDAFVDTVLKDCGYKIIHTRYIWPDILDNI